MANHLPFKNNDDIEDRRVDSKDSVGDPTENQSHKNDSLEVNIDIDFNSEPDMEEDSDFSNSYKLF